MITTRFTELVGCTVPIQQAGMGAASPPALAAAVSEAGGLGMLGTARGGLTAITLANLLDQVCSLTDKPFGVNFIVAPVFRNVLDLKCIEIAARAAKVVEFFYAKPERQLVEMVHAGGALACWQIGSRQEAIMANEAGCDFVIAQGVEAGGHVRGTTPAMKLLGDVIAAVDVPVLAAGGIGTGRAMAAALAAGADGVRVGTRFVAATETASHPEYVAALIAAEAHDTVWTETFSGGWPDAPTAFCAHASRQPKPLRAMSSARLLAWTARGCRSLAFKLSSSTRPRQAPSRRCRSGRVNQSAQ